MSEIANFLRAQYAEARAAEAGRKAIPGGLPFRWTAVWSQDDPHFLINEIHRVSEDEFRERYGEPAADPDVLADLDAKLALIDDLLAERHEVVDGDCWYTCAAATEERDGGETCDDGRRGGPCDCGRDARVNRRLAILAQPFAGHPDHKGKEWAP